ncbi:hypothetical protein BsWGS_14072 [Bradybaena similaris]
MRQYATLRDFVKYALEKLKEQPHHSRVGVEQLDAGRQQSREQVPGQCECNDSNFDIQNCAENFNASLQSDVADIEPTTSKLGKQTAISDVHHALENNAATAASQPSEKTPKERKDCESRRKKKKSEGEISTKEANEIFEKNQANLEEECSNKQKQEQALSQAAINNDTDSVNEVTLSSLTSYDIHSPQSTTFDVSTSGLLEAVQISYFSSGHEMESSVDPVRGIKDTENELDNGFSDTVLSSPRQITSNSPRNGSNSVDGQEYTEASTSRMVSSFFTNGPSTSADLATSALVTISSLGSHTGRQDADSALNARPPLVGLESILDGDLDQIANQRPENNHMAHNRHRRFRPIQAPQTSTQTLQPSTQSSQPSTSNAQPQPRPQNIVPNSTLPALIQERQEENIPEVMHDQQPVFLLNIPLSPLLLAQIRDAQGGAAILRQHSQRVITPPPQQQNPPPPLHLIPPPPPPPPPPQLQARRQPLLPNVLDEMGGQPPAVVFPQHRQHALPRAPAPGQRHQFRRHSSSTR